MSDDVPDLIREPLGPIDWVYEAISFVSLWFVTRSLWRFLCGLPALAVFIGIPVLALTGRTTINRESVKLSYLRAAIDAAKNEDWAAAQLWNQKLLTFNPSDSEARFRLALAVEGAGDIDRSRDLLRALTPANNAGFAPAHLYLAGKIMEQGNDATPDELRTAVWQLHRALEIEPENLQAREMLVRLQIHRGELEDAAAHLSKLVSKRPELHLMLAGLYAQMNRHDAKESAGNQARVHFEHLRSKNPDELEPLLRLVEAHIVTQNFAAAEQLLSEHLAKQLDVDAVKLALLKLAFLEIDVELKRPQPNWSRVIVLLERSLSAFPSQEQVFARIALVVGRFQGAEADRLRQVLTDALADGRAPAACHMLLGTMLGVNGKTAEAVQHLESARQAFPENPVVLNNLAWYLMQSDPPQLEEALTHVNLALEKAPRIPEIRETRGRVLAKLGRPAEALPDLEAALKMKTVDPDLHATLASVYQQLGNTEMANEHRQRAAQKAK